MPMIVIKLIVKIIVPNLILCAHVQDSCNVYLQEFLQCSHKSMQIPCEINIDIYIKLLSQALIAITVHA